MVSFQSKMFAIFLSFCLYLSPFSFFLLVASYLLFVKNSSLYFERQPQLLNLE